MERIAVKEEEWRENTFHMELNHQQTPERRDVTDLGGPYRACVLSFDTVG